MGKHYLKLLAILTVAVVGGKFLANLVFGATEDWQETGVQIALGVLIFSAVAWWDQKNNPPSAH